MGQQTLVWIIRNFYKVDTHTDAPLIRPPLPMVLNTSTSHVSLPPSDPTSNLIPPFKEECITPKCTAGVVSFGRYGSGWRVGRNRGVEESRWRRKRLVY